MKSVPAQPDDIFGLSLHRVCGFRRAVYFFTGECDLTVMNFI